mmetsp:Transcript_75545/g.179480  ORF Transcript_75545/g.179480 Transcript_75545/m.179480 type:complete len:278 (-) Transcript_75545:116-949(-)
MANLYSEAARKTAKIEGDQHREELKKHGLLDLKRAVIVKVCPHEPGQEVPPGSKVLHTIRHGQGFHNLLADIYREAGKEVDCMGAGGESPYKRPEIFDAPLTAIGIRQAQALQPAAVKLEGVELVVVSPLCRAVQTANVAFEHLLPPLEDLQSPPKVPFLAHPQCTEMGGVNLCDKRRPLKVIRRDFPHVDFSLFQDEEDPRWSDDKREDPKLVSDRCFDFCLWLKERPEKEVVVATHSAWLFTLFNTVFECSSPDLTDWFLTGEMRSVQVTFSDRE